MPAITAPARTGDPYVDALLSDAKWATADLTYSFPTSSSLYGSGYGDGENNNGFAALNTAQKEAAKAALDAVAPVANLQFTEISETSVRQADLRFAMSDQPQTAWAYYPTTGAEGGDSWFNHSSGDYSDPVLGNYAHSTFLHELGHALGLEHAHEGSVMPAAGDTMEFTVMGYRSYVGAPLTGYTNERFGYAQSLMMYDIAALQHLYGANYASNGGDTVYRWSAATGEMSVNGAGQGAPGVNRIFMTVWDGDGQDTYDFSNYSTALTVDLRPGEWTTTSSTQLVELHYDGSKMARGNVANALLHDGNLGSLIENARGGSGNDEIMGNVGANKLYGNAGNDGLTGREGNDLLTGGLGADQLEGGSGSDGASYAGATAGVVADLLFFYDNADEARGDSFDSIERLYGSRFNDSLRGDNLANTISGAGGNDAIHGRDGDDVLAGGNGDDTLTGGAGADRLAGGAGDDMASYRNAAALVVADLMFFYDNAGEAGGDSFDSVERIYGSRLNDSLRGDNSANEIAGGHGDDALHGRGGADTLAGGSGGDRLVGGEGADRLDGGAGDDMASFGSAGEDVVADLMFFYDNAGEAGGDTFTALEQLGGSRFNDSLRGDSVANAISGGIGNDALHGRGGDDILEGGSGDDTLVGGEGADVLIGGAGSDRFLFRSADESSPVAGDRIEDFLSGVDRLDFRAIDADSGQAGDQAFSFIGDGLFGGLAGELNLAGCVLSGDTNGDEVADFQVNFVNVATLQDSDFLL